MAQNGPKASIRTCSLYGIDCDGVARRDVSGRDVSGVMCHVDGVRIGGWGRVEVSSGESMRVGWTNTGLMVGPVVLDVVGVVNMVSSGSVSMREGGNLVGTVCGHDSLALGIASLVAGGRVSWGASSVI